MECVTNPIVFFVVDHSFNNCSFKWSLTISSNAPNGSSISNISASNASARAILALCCIPPDSCHGNFLSNPDNSTSSKTRVTRSFCSSLS